MFPLMFRKINEENENEMRGESPNPAAAVSQVRCRACLKVPVKGLLWGQRPFPIFNLWPLPSTFFLRTQGIPAPFLENQINLKKKERT